MMLEDVVHQEVRLAYRWTAPYQWRKKRVDLANATAQTVLRLAVAVKLKRVIGKLLVPDSEQYALIPTAHYFSGRLRCLTGRIETDQAFCQNNQFSV